MPVIGRWGTDYRTVCPAVRKMSNSRAYFLPLRLGGPERGALEPLTSSTANWSRNSTAPLKRLEKKPLSFPTHKLLFACYNRDKELTAAFCYGFLQGTLEALDQRPNRHAKSFCLREDWKELHFRPDEKLTKAAYHFLIGLVSSLKTDRAMGREPKKHAFVEVAVFAAMRNPCVKSW